MPKITDLRDIQKIQNSVMEYVVYCWTFYPRMHVVPIEHTMRCFLAWLENKDKLMVLEEK